MLVMVYIKLFSGDQVIVVISPRLPFIWAKKLKAWASGGEKGLNNHSINLRLAIVFQVKSCLMTPFKRK